VDKQVFRARARINFNNFTPACDCEGVIVLKKIAIVISSMLMGIFGGAAVGWLIGRAVFFFAVELPNRNLPPEQLAIATSDQGVGVGVLTFFFLIPTGVAMGAGAGLWIGMRQVNDEAKSD
jgi:hypothetical protein